MSVIRRLNVRKFKLESLDNRTKEKFNNIPNKTIKIVLIPTNQEYLFVKTLSI
jgi:acetate kinase